MWPVGEGDRSVRVEQDVARVPDYYPAALNVDREPDLFGAAVCIDEVREVVALAKRDTVRAVCPHPVLMDDRALKVSLRIIERLAHYIYLEIQGDREAACRGVRHRYWLGKSELDRARRVRGGDLQEHKKEGAQGTTAERPGRIPPQITFIVIPFVQAFQRTTACSGVELR